MMISPQVFRISKMDKQNGTEGIIIEKVKTLIAKSLDFTVQVLKDPSGYDLNSYFSRGLQAS